jgi:hypothetical protein
MDHFSANQLSDLPAEFIAAGIARLRAEHHGLKNSPGVRTGFNWAIRYGTYKQLLHWSSWVSTASSSREPYCFAATKSANPSLSLGDVREATEALFLRDGGLTSEQINDNAFILDFAKGALRALDAADSADTRAAQPYDERR